MKDKNPIRTANSLEQLLKKYTDAELAEFSRGLTASGGPSLRRNNQQDWERIRKNLGR